MNALPSVADLVLYHPGTSDDIAGGHRALAAIVVAVDSAGALSLAIFEIGGRILFRHRALGEAAWRAAGADPAIGYWRHRPAAGPQPAPAT